MKAKTTYYLALLLATAGIMAGFNACTEEPEPDPFVNDTGGGVGGGGIQIGGGNDDEEEEEEQTFRVTSFTYADEYGLPDNSQLTRLYYDTAGRLTRGNFYEGEYLFNISYFALNGEPRQIEMEFNGNSSSSTVLENFQLNAQGYVTYAEFTDYEEGRGICTGRYDAEGHLLEWTEETYQGNELTSEYTHTYTWDGDDLVEVNFTYASSNGINYEMFKFVYPSSSQRNPARGVPWFSDLWEGYEMTILRYADLLGKTSRNVPTSISYRSSFSEEWAGYANLQTGYNSDGSLSWIRFTGEGDDETETLFFGYDGNDPGQY